MCAEAPGFEFLVSGFRIPSFWFLVLGFVVRGSGFGVRVKTEAIERAAGSERKLDARCSAVKDVL